MTSDYQIAAHWRRIRATLDSHWNYTEASGRGHHLWGKGGTKMVRISRISENSLRIMAARKQLLYYTCSLIGCGPDLSTGPDRSMAKLIQAPIFYTYPL
jgi:hypothetical protein